METLFCSKCQTNHPVSEFYLRRNTKRGYQRWCKTSGKKHQQEANAAHPEKQKLRKAIYNAAHREALSAYGKKRTASGANKASLAKARARRGKEMRAYQRQYRLDHLAKALKLERASRERNREKSLIRSRAYYAANRGKFAAYNKLWTQNNPEKVLANAARRRARKKNAPQVEHVVRTVVFERDKWTCQLCFKKVNRTVKYPHPDTPTIDHIVPLSKGGSHTYANVVCVCARCNSSKKNRAVTQQIRLF